MQYILLSSPCLSRARCHPSTPGMPCPGAVSLTSHFPDACLLPEGLREIRRCFESSSGQGRQGNSKKAQLYIKAEELGNKLAFLVLERGNSFICPDQKGYSATTCVHCTVQPTWPYKPLNNNNGESGEHECQLVIHGCSWSCTITTKPRGECSCFRSSIDARILY